MQHQPRRQVHCGYCKKPGHNIAGCDIYKIKLELTIINSNLDILSQRKQPSHLKLNQQNIRNFTQIKLLLEGHLPYYIRYNYIIKKTEDEALINIEKKGKVEIKQLKSELIDFEKENNIINEYAIIFNDIRRRIWRYKEMCLDSYYISWKVLTEILKRDNYIEYIEQLNNDRIREQEEHRRQIEEYRQQQQAELLARSSQTYNNDAILSRTLLPIIRESMIEMSDCPICLEPLSETNISVLRCGHPLCTNCLITQTLIKIKNGMCKCPICRERFV